MQRKRKDSGCAYDKALSVELKAAHATHRQSLLLARLAAPLAARAVTCSRQSPAHTVALLELCPSEDGSSCPSAERGLRELSTRFSAEQLAPGGRGQWRRSIDRPTEWKRADLGVAAFVGDRRAGEALQAVSMPACV